MLRTIERSTKTKVEQMDLPTKKDIEVKRKERFKLQLKTALGDKDLSVYKDVIKEFLDENEFDTEDVAAALAKLSLGDRPLVLENFPETESLSEKPKRDSRERRSRSRRRPSKRTRDSKRPSRRKEKERNRKSDKKSKPKTRNKTSKEGASKPGKVGRAGSSKKRSKKAAKARN